MTIRFFDIHEGDIFHRIWGNGWTVYFAKKIEKKIYFILVSLNEQSKPAVSDIETTVYDWNEYHIAKNYFQNDSEREHQVIMALFDNIYP